MNRRSPTRRTTHDDVPQPGASPRISQDGPTASHSADRFPDHSRRDLAGSWRRNRPLIAVLMTAGIVVATLAIFTPRFETNDDAGMNAIVAGRIFVDRPDEHLIYSNVLIGMGLKGLYQATPNVPWYGGYLFLTASLSLAAVAYVFLGPRVSMLDV